MRNFGWVLNEAGVGPLGAVGILLALIVFALVWHNFVGPRPRELNSHAAPAPVFRDGPRADAQPLPPRDPALPDWSEADSPLLEDAELEWLMQSLAKSVDIPERVLPRVGRPTGQDGEYVFRDESGYVYTGYERGGAMFEHCSVVADQLMYFVFRDRGFMQAYMGLMDQNLPPEEHARRLKQARAEMLGRIDPLWERQFSMDEG